MSSLTVTELAGILNIKPSAVLGQLMRLGVQATVNQEVTVEEAFLVAKNLREDAALFNPMSTCPRDGTLVRLYVLFDDNSLEDENGPQWTIGFNNSDQCYQRGDGDEDDEDEFWNIAGWDWNGDRFVSAHVNAVFGWLPMVEKV